MKRLHKVIIILFAVVSAALAVAAELAPDALVKKTTDEVLEILRQDKDIQAGSSRKVLDLVEAKVLPHFDFTHMTRLAVGKNWSKATKEQQETLVREFRNLLVRTYSTALTTYRNQTVEVKPVNSKAGETDVSVRTVVNQPGGQPVPIDYSMEKTPQGWKVYDVTVDGVSLVTNYRSTFTNEIRQSGIDGLIKTLAEKNKTGEKPQAAASKSDKALGKTEKQ